MAVIALGRPIKTNLDGAMAYIIDPAKTDGGRLVGSNYATTGTDWHRLAQPMIDDNLASPHGIREGSRLAYHIKMSFSPDDPVTPELAHRLGMEFARRITGGDYRFVVATHTDRHHLHNHIMVCAAAMDEPHLKAELPKDIIDQWREVSDEICRREGLSVIDRASAPLPERGPEQPPAADPAPPSAPDRAGARPAGTTATRDEPRGCSMAELYATLKGMGVKDRIRTCVDVFAAEAGSLDELADTLDLNGVRMTVRGSHVTYEYKPTGFKVRDSKLGPAYALEHVMARIGDSPVTPITFNRRLIARETERTVTVWLPGTGRRRRITLPRTCVVGSGSTCRAYLPANRVQPVTDRRGRYVEHVASEGLYRWFGRPRDHVAPLTREDRLPVEAGVSAAQRRYYAAQARQLDVLADRAEALNAAVRWSRNANGDAGRGMRLLRDRVAASHAELQAAVVALNDAIANGDTAGTVEARDEMEARERMAARYERELAAVERAVRSTRDDDADRDRTPHRRNPGPRL